MLAARQRGVERFALPDGGFFATSTPEIMPSEHKRTELRNHGK
jgi:hypothetical protein